ncbi:MAG: hypothetical protein ABSH56_23680 [Bryobacteraceae bacterium]
MQKKATLIGLLFLAAAIVPAGFADTPGRHAHYLRARTDLRAAQWLLRVHDEPNVMNHIRAVDQEIDRAVFEMDQAAALPRRGQSSCQGVAESGLQPYRRRHGPIAAGGSRSPPRSPGRLLSQNSPVH